MDHTTDPDTAASLDAAAVSLPDGFSLSEWTRYTTGDEDTGYRMGYVARLRVPALDHDGKTYVDAIVIDDREAISLPVEALRQIMATRIEIAVLCAQDALSLRQA